VFLFLCCSVLFVNTKSKSSQPSDWLGRLTFVISFVSKAFPYKDQIEDLFVVMVYFMYSQHLQFSTFSLISIFLNCNILIKGTI